MNRLSCWHSFACQLPQKNSNRDVTESVKALAALPIATRAETWNRLRPRPRLGSRLEESQCGTSTSWRVDHYEEASVGPGNSHLPTTPQNVVGGPAKNTGDRVELKRQNFNQNPSCERETVVLADGNPLDEVHEKFSLENKVPDGWRCGEDVPEVSETPVKVPDGWKHGIAAITGLDKDLRKVYRLEHQN